jgi:hypothetical protein
MISFWKFAAVALTFTSFGLGQQILSSCGDPVDGIELCLSSTAAKDKFFVEIKNVGTTDLVLNLGEMVGSKQYANAIVLVFDEEKGKPFDIELAGPAFVAGHIVPLVVPLPTGASLKIPIRFTKELFGDGYPIELTEPHTMRVRLVGKDPDSKEFSMLSYWKGTVFSNTLKVGP